MISRKNQLVYLKPLSILSPSEKRHGNATVSSVWSTFLSQLAKVLWFIKKLIFSLILNPRRSQIIKSPSAFSLVSSSWTPQVRDPVSVDTSYSQSCELFSALCKHWWMSSAVSAVSNWSLIISHTIWVCFQEMGDVIYYWLMSEENQPQHKLLNNR